MARPPEAPMIGALLKPHLLLVDPHRLSQETGYAKGSWYSWLSGMKAMPCHLFDRLVQTLPLDPDDVAVARLEASDSERRPHHKGQTDRVLPPVDYPLTQALFSPHTGSALELSQRYGYAPETWGRWLKGQRQMPEPLFNLAVELFHLTGHRSVEEARVETKSMLRCNRPRSRYRPDVQPALPPPSFSEALSIGGELGAGAPRPQGRGDRFIPPGATGSQPPSTKLDPPPATFFEAVQKAAWAFHPTPREVHQVARWLISGKQVVAMARSGDQG